VLNFYSAGWSTDLITVLTLRPFIVQPKQRINVVEKGRPTSCSHDSLIFPPKSAKGEETRKIAPPTTVVTIITGRTKSASPVMASAEGFSSTVFDQANVGSASTTLKNITLQNLNSVACIEPFSWKFYRQLLQIIYVISL